MTDQERAEKTKEYQAKYRAKNREKQAEYAKAYREKNKEKVAEYGKHYFKENKDKYAEYARNRGPKRTEYMRQYREANRERLDAYKKEWYQTTYNARQEAEAGRPRATFCEICGQASNHEKQRTPTVFDHDHRTGKFRGWICHAHNTVLGLAKDDPKFLLQAIQYLEKHGYTFDQCIQSKSVPDSIP